MTPASRTSPANRAHVNNTRTTEGRSSAEPGAQPPSVLPPAQMSVVRENINPWSRIIKNPSCLGLSVLCGLALIFTLKAAYTCNFAGRKGASFGVWETQSVGGGDVCVDWVNLNQRDGHIRVVKCYAITASVSGILTVTSLVVGAFVETFPLDPFLIVVGACISATTTGALFQLYASSACRTANHCYWLPGSYLCIFALILWGVGALLSARLLKHQDGQVQSVQQRVAAVCSFASTHSIQLRRMMLLASCTLAFIFTVTAAQTCRFITGTEEIWDDVDQDWQLTLPPSSRSRDFGAWRYQHGDICIFWMEQDGWASDGDLVAVMLYTLLATVTGFLVWLLTAWGVVKGFTEHHVKLAVAGSFACMGLTLAFYQLFFSYRICSARFCTWGQGAKLNIAALVFWVITLLSLLSPIPPDDGEAAINRTGANRTEEHPTRSRNEHENENETSALEDVEEQGTGARSRGDGADFSHSSPTPTLTRNGLAHEGAVPKTLNTPRVSVWKDKNGRLMKTRMIQSRNEQGRIVIERTREALTPVGSPLVSVSEDDLGRWIKTTILEYTDSDGEVFTDKVVEFMESTDSDDNDGDGDDNDGGEDCQDVSVGHGSQFDEEERAIKIDRQG